MFLLPSANVALKVLPGFMPIFSVLKSYYPFLMFSFITMADCTNACSTFAAVLALVSKNIRLCFSPNSCPSSVDTSRSIFRSDLLPIRRIIIFEYALSRMSSSHLTRLSKVYLRVISYTRSAHILPRQQLLVIDLKDSWPAVSQICTLTLVPSLSLIVLDPKSTPMVKS